MATCSPNDLLYAGRCFLGLPQPQMDAIIAALLCQILQTNNPMATCDVQTLLDDGKCFTCLPQKQILAIQTQLLCEILHGGGSGTTCIVCLDADGAPVDDAPCPCSIAYNMLGQFWFWNSLTSTWFPISL